MKNKLAAVLVVLTLALPSLAQEMKFRSAQPAGGLPGRYLVSVTLQPGEDLGAVSRQLAAQYGVRIELYAAEGFTGFAIVGTEERARLMSADPRVVTIADLPRIERPAAREAAQKTPIRRPSVVVAATAASNTIPGLGEYTYDGSGNIVQIGDHTFRYDLFGRLESATLGQPYKQEFSYDRYGNILTIINSVWSTQQSGYVVDRTAKHGVNPKTNRIDVAKDTATQVPNTVFGEYDANGNLTRQRDLPDRMPSDSTFTYDATNTMTGSRLDNVERVYLYTASDERIASIFVSAGVAAGSEWTVRDASARPLRRLARSATGEWSWNEDYIYAGNKLLAAEVPAAEKVRHFYLDHLGTPRLITGNGGVALATSTYYPFGAEATSSSGEQLKFTGHERDVPSLDYMHARYYQPFAGRFLSVDPTWDSADLGKPQSWNRYAYVRNNPVNMTDPDGRLPLLSPETVEKQSGYLVKVIADWILPDGEGLDPDPAPSRAAISTAAAAVVSLEQRTKEIHGVVSEQTRKRTTIAAADVINADGSTEVLVASSEKNLRRAQKAAMRAGETAVSGAGHAEQKIIAHAARNGQTVERIAASRPICSECALVIERAGVKAVSAFKRLLHSVF